LELGASPNVYDEKSLTPLYHTVLIKQTETINDSSYCCQLLLQDHSIVNCVLLFRGADTTIVNKSNQTPYELALVSQNPSIGSIIQSHKTDHVVPFRETPIINPKRRSIYIEPDKHSNSLSFNSRSQSMPKLNGINLLRRSHSPSTNEQFSQQHQSSRSSSPKSFSDHGFGSECASHLSSNSPNGTNAGYTCKRKRLYAAAPGRKSLCIKSYQANTPGELSINKGDIVESMFAISVFQ